MTRLKPFAVLLLVAAMAGWIINQYMVVKTRSRIYPTAGEVPQVDAVIVPGASVYRSGKLSPVLRQRMEAAMAFLAQRPGLKLVLSGHAIPNGYNETLAMVEFARRNAIPAEDIVVDDKGRSTYVTLLNYRRKFGSRRILIVSQDYHLPRALYIADRLGIVACGLVAAEAPSSRFHVREYAGRIKDFVLLRVNKYFHAD